MASVRLEPNSCLTFNRLLISGFSMQKKAFFASLTLLMLVSSASAISDAGQPGADLENEEIVMPAGQDMTWQNYEFEYEKSPSGDILSITGPEGVLAEQYSGIELYEEIGQIKKISGNLYFRIEEVVHDDEEIEMAVWAPEGSFGSSELNISAPNYIVESSGDSFTLPLQIRNEGGLKEAYELSAESESAVSTSFTYQGYNITKIEVEPGEEKQVTAEVDIDDEAGNGLYSINFSIYNRSFSSKEFRFQVINSSESERELRMTLDESYMEKSSGETLETTVRVENIGDMMAENIEPSISTPDNWNYTVSPEETANISSEEFQDFKLEVSVPSTATSGDYFVDIGLENTEDFDSGNLRVNVSDSSGGFGLIGAVLALMAILLVAGVYKVFGRR